MEKAEFRKNAADMIYLTACAVNGITPKKERLDSMDIKKVFEVCQKHILTACAAYALESAGVKEHDFTQAKEKAIRKNVLLDAERVMLLKRLEEEHIWYMPLKGALLKDWYPKLGMRQMSDNDILCDSSRRADIKKIMLEMGFTCRHYGIGNDDAYLKEPVCNFEMHNALFTSTHVGKLCDYYSDVEKRLIKDEDNEYSRHFSNEDFYIYMIAHEYKHYATGGTGVRSLLDIYIFQKLFGDLLDRDYIDRELKELELEDYERNARELAEKVFTLKALTIEEKKLLDYYVISGTYGTVSNHVENKLQKTAQGSKFKYIIRRIFPDMKTYKVWYPWAYKHKWLLPAAWAFRLVRGITVRRKTISSEVKALKNN